MSSTSDPTFYIAIPSYKRATILATMTLPLLLGRGVPEDRIHVWTASPEETEEYRETVGLFLPEGNINEHGGGVGMGNARNALLKHYEKGTRLLQLDDDLRQIHRKIEEDERSNFGPFTEKGAQPVARLVEMVNAGFDLADEEGVSLWSTYPVKNPFYMGFRSRIGNLYAEGAWFGMTLRHDETEQVDLDDKEDFERSVKHYLRDGGVLRLENYGFVTQFYGTPGGMQEYRTTDTVSEGAAQMLLRYPDWVRSKPPSRTNPEMEEIKLHPQNARQVRLVEVP